MKHRFCKLHVLMLLECKKAQNLPPLSKDSDKNMFELYKKFDSSPFMPGASKKCSIAKKITQK